MLKKLQDIPAAEVARNFAKVSDQALREPVRITSHGRPRLVLLSVEEYERLKQRDRQALLIEELTDEEMEAILSAQPSPESEAYADWACSPSA